MLPVCLYKLAVPLSEQFLNGPTSQHIPRHAAPCNPMQDKNKDFVVAEHASLLGGSNQPFVAQLFYEAPDPSEGHKMGG